MCGDLGFTVAFDVRDLVDALQDPLLLDRSLGEDPTAKALAGKAHPASVHLHRQNVNELRLDCDELLESKPLVEQACEVNAVIASHASIEGLSPATQAQHDVHGCHLRRHV